MRPRARDRRRAVRRPGRSPHAIGHRRPTWRARGKRSRARKASAIARSERAIARFREAAKIEAIARRGHAAAWATCSTALGRYDAALATWTAIERRSDGSARCSTSLHLFRGLALESYGRIEQARRSYLAALAQSGRALRHVRLAALAFVHGRGDDRIPLVDALLRNDDPRRDPWWSYYAADWRFWYPRIERVRAPWWRSDAPC